MVILDWIDITKIALQDLWQGFINFIPNLLGAIVVFLIGWLIAVAVGKLVAEVLKRVKFNKIFETGGWKKALEKAEIKADASAFVGAIIKWVLLIVFLIIAVKILGFTQLERFFEDVLAYLPNVVIAALIFVVAVIIADILEKVVRAGVEGVKVGYGQIIGAIVRWSIWIFAILAILDQLRIQAASWMVEMIQIAFIGVVLMIALAFGLGGKDVAAEILQNLRNKLRS